MTSKVRIPCFAWVGPDIEPKSVAKSAWVCWLKYGSISPLHILVIGPKARWESATAKAQLLAPFSPRQDL
jgi:hypothetical protein